MFKTSLITGGMCYRPGGSLTTSGRTRTIWFSSGANGPSFGGKRFVVDVTNGCHWHQQKLRSTKGFPTWTGTYWHWISGLGSSVMERNQIKGTPTYHTLRSQGHQNWGNCMRQKQSCTCMCQGISVRVLLCVQQIINSIESIDVLSLCFLAYTFLLILIGDLAFLVTSSQFLVLTKWWHKHCRMHGLSKCP